MSYDASFVGLTILDISGRPIVAIPEKSNVGFIEEIRLNPAGTASGSLINAAKLGLECLPIAAVGNDEKGNFILDYYSRMEIDCSMIQRTDDAPTSATILPIRSNGDRPGWHCRGASDHLFVKEDDFDKVCDAKVLHHGGTGLLNAMDHGQSAKLLKYAKAKGLTVTFDLIAPDTETVELLKPILPHVDYFMPSMEEAEILSGESEPSDIVKFFMDLGVGTCVLKWGPKGSYVANVDGHFRVPAYEVEVSDTTGCGDSYCGGFIAGLVKGFDLENSCRLGTAASALVATALGSDAGVIDFEQTIKFMQSGRILE